ncbi:MAG TPA: hypothetical protein VJW75_00320 [Candidatus Eisenbacteria bacterium]|nr:hypothetical protein [Candidatus Eisenbacteria bacterium]
MRRLSVVAAVLIAAGIGIVDPYACVQYSQGAGAEREVPMKDRNALLRIAIRARNLVPAPGRRYVADPGSDEAKSEAKAAWDDRAGKWAAPGIARATRSFPPANPDAPDAPPEFEIRTFVNAEAGLPEALASVFGEPRPFAVKGAVAVEITTIGAEDESPSNAGAEGGRVIMPVTPESKANAITLLRVLVADPESERALRDLSQGKSVDRSARRPVARVDRVESITVGLYGAKQDVERVARRLPIARLRALLSK